MSTPPVLFECVFGHVARGAQPTIEVPHLPLVRDFHVFNLTRNTPEQAGQGGGGAVKLET